MDLERKSRIDWRTSASFPPRLVRVVEVRGYAKGGAAGGFLRSAHDALRCRDRQAAELVLVRRQPPAGKDPEQRHPPLRSNPTESDIAEDGGLVADTTELFRLARDVEAALSHRRARGVLSWSVAVASLQRRPKQDLGAMQDPRLKVRGAPYRL